MQKTCHYRCACGATGATVMGSALDEDALPCAACGKVNNPHLVSYGDPVRVPQNDGPLCFAKGRDYEFNKARNIPSMGRFVRSDQAQHELYQDRIGAAAKRARELRRGRGRRHDIQWEHIGKVPLELHESVVENERDKECWQKDPIGLLKATGCYFGD